MSQGDRIITRHPAGKQGVNISRAKYDQIRDAIESILQEHESLTFSALRDAVSERVGPGFDGSVSWYFTTVKLDLEARGVIERVGSARPQQLRAKRP